MKPLINYIVDQVNEREGVVGKTALVKLVYLVDVEHYRRHGKVVTGLKWRFHHYGPYAVELETNINSLGGVIDEDRFTGMIGDRLVSGYRYVRAGDWKEIESAFNPQYGASVKWSVDQVVERWALEPLSTILDYVYFETEPMQDAKRGEYLDFSTVPLELPTRRNTAKLKLPEEAENGLHRRLKERREKPSPEIRKATEPAYDDIYTEACKLMATEESPGPYFRRSTKVSGPNSE